VIYDISDNKRRFEMAAALKRLGLTRIQRSAFIGPYSSSIVSDIKNVARKIIDPQTDNVQIYPLTPASYRLRVVIGHEFSETQEMGWGYVV
jgi:CRISPR-associated protein Cas2